MPDYLFLCMKGCWALEKYTNALESARQEQNWVIWNFFKV
jgi:hypothetical protein